MLIRYVAWYHFTYIFICCKWSDVLLYLQLVWCLAIAQPKQVSPSFRHISFCKAWLVHSSVWLSLTSSPRLISSWAVLRPARICAVLEGYVSEKGSRPTAEPYLASFYAWNLLWHFDWNHHVDVNFQIRLLAQKHFPGGQTKHRQLTSPRLKSRNEATRISRTTSKLPRISQRSFRLFCVKPRLSGVERYNSSF